MTDKEVDFISHDLTRVEWEAWQEVVREFKKVFPGLDFNDPKLTPLVDAIENWGDSLVTLRIHQNNNGIKFN